MYPDCEKKPLNGTCEDVAKFYGADACFILLADGNDNDDAPHIKYNSFGWVRNCEKAIFKLKCEIVDQTGKVDKVADVSRLGLTALKNQLEDILRDTERASCAAKLPDINCESVAKLLKKCAQALELAKLNYEYICKPTADSPDTNNCDLIMDMKNGRIIGTVPKSDTNSSDHLKAEYAVVKAPSPCARCDGVVVEVNEINATALRMAIDFCRYDGSVDENGLLCRAQRFKDFLEN